LIALGWHGGISSARAQETVLWDLEQEQEERAAKLGLWTDPKPGTVGVAKGG